MGAKHTYSGDSISLTLRDYVPSPHPVTAGQNTCGVYFDGYPQIVKEAGSQPVYEVKTEKDLTVTVRDGTRLFLDVYRPDVEEDRFPAILAWGFWGKDAQAAVAWLHDKQQPYYDSPFWDGSLEAGNYLYTVPRGYAHVIPDPRGVGDSEGFDGVIERAHNPDDIYDVIEWIAAQPWCDGNVGMMGPSSYSIAQLEVAKNPPPSLKAIRPDEAPVLASDHFHGIFDTLLYHILLGRHGNDSLVPAPHYPYTLKQPRLWSLLPKEDLEARLAAVLDHPDIKYNSKWYSQLKYPLKHPLASDMLLNAFHPMPANAELEKIRIPMYIGAPWVNRFYNWGTFEAYQRSSTPAKSKKLIVYPPGFPPRPYCQYHDEIVRWYDYWLKGIDTGIMDEPPVKLFVMGVNRWRFEDEWPLTRTRWTSFFLHPKGRLSTDPAPEGGPPDSFTQPAPYLDPTVYCLRYETDPFSEDTEITGPLALHLEASIDADDTNWIVDLVDVDPAGNRQWISVGYLKAAYRALDEGKSKPHQPIHPRQNAVPVPPGEKVEYAIAMMHTSNVFKKGHSMELIVRNQDDLHSRLGTWGVYMLPFMRTVTHEIHFGRSHLLLPVIPSSGD